MTWYIALYSFYINPYAMIYKQVDIMPVRGIVIL